jgi:hypothetical protein
LSFGVKHFLDVVSKDQENEEKRRREAEEDALLELFLSDDASAIETLAMGGRRPAPQGPQGGVTREPERKRADPVRTAAPATQWRG